MTDLMTNCLLAILDKADNVNILSAYHRIQGLSSVPAGLEPKPLIIYGFDSEEHIRKNESGSILDAPGVFYLRLPALLSEIEGLFKKALNTRILANYPIDQRSLRDLAIKRLHTFKHRFDNLCASMEMNANRARKELESSPDIMPQALFEFNATNIQNLLSEYKEYKDLVMNLGIADGDKVPRMMNNLLVATLQIEDKATAPSDALDLAFKSVNLVRAISNILGQEKGL